MNCFELRGVETSQRREICAGRLLGFLIHAPRVLLRVLSPGAVKDSTIVDGKAIPTGSTLELEHAGPVPLSLHVASIYLTCLFRALYSTLLLQLRWDFCARRRVLATLFELHCYALLPAYVFQRKAWACWIHPAIALLTARNSLIAAGTVRMLREHPQTIAGIVVMGRAHAAGHQRELLDRFGFVRADGG